MEGDERERERLALVCVYIEHMIHVYIRSM